MGTPFEAPETDVERPGDETYGRTRFTVAMMRSLKWIRVFHGVFGVGAVGIGALSLLCGGVSVFPLAVGAGDAPGLGQGMLVGVAAVYLAIGGAYLAIGGFLLSGAWSLQRASVAEDATRDVEAALRSVVRLWVAFTVVVVGGIVAYGAAIALVIAFGASMSKTFAPPP